MRIDDVRTLLLKRCGEAGGQAAFATAHDLNAQYISQVLHSQRPPSDRLCKVLGIKSDGLRWVKR